MQPSTDLDLRHLPVWERAAIVLDRADVLETGERFAFLTEIHPRALVSRLDQLRPGAFSFEPRRIGAGHWRIDLRRVPAVSGKGAAAAFVRNPMLARLSDETRRAFQRDLTEHDLRKGDIVVNENEQRDFLGIVTAGVLGIFAGGGGRERLLYHRFTYDLTGEIEFLDGGLAVGKTVVLSKGASVARIPYETVRAHIASEPEFFQGLAAYCAQYARALAQSLTEQVHQPILSRVAIALLPYAAPERGLHPALPPLVQMTQSQVAAAAGTVKEVAARAIAELERAGAIRRERGHIAYLDRTKLLESID
ncbi:MAG TPA: DUF2249 domain-containing protein [Candidatus Baltobacteraceae bacterium]|nr:DUF2249 domain-containing protein [Candidatus Baltobacteraceae bacterium]